MLKRNRLGGLKNVVRSRCHCHLSVTSILIPTVSLAGVVSSPVAAFDISLFRGGIVIGKEEREAVSRKQGSGMQWVVPCGRQFVPKRKKVWAKQGGEGDAFGRDVILNVPLGHYQSITTTKPL